MVVAEEEEEENGEGRPHPSRRQAPNTKHLVQETQLVLSRQKSNHNESETVALVSVTPKLSVRRFQLPQVEVQ